MKVVLALDKFKGSATASELSCDVQQALSDLPGVQVVTVPVADGGDGTTAALAGSHRGQWVTLQSPAPLLHLDPVNASYYCCDDGTAFIEVAAASGLALVPEDRRDVMRATSLGTGLMMLDAIERGCHEIILGLGGSATCDGGMGIMSALGAEFLDNEYHHLYPSGASLDQITHIETRGIPSQVQDCRFTLLTDVNIPLCGETGAATVFAPQKGATPQQVTILDNGLRHLSSIIGNRIAAMPGCGAAGGIPALMMHLLQHCQLLPGAPFVLDSCGLDDALDGADLVITGEGRLDSQTLMGKAPGVVIDRARQRGIPVAAVCGAIDPALNIAMTGLQAAIAVSGTLPHEQAMDNAGTRARVAAAIRQIVLKG